MNNTDNRQEKSGRGRGGTGRKGDRGPKWLKDEAEDTGQAADNGHGCSQWRQ